jgi:hypothetical protein
LFLLFIAHLIFFYGVLRFDRFILTLITISSLLMAIDGPETEANAELTLGLLIVDVVFTLLFTLEVIVKMQALGVICHSSAYMRDAWNVLDFVIVAASLANLSLEAVTRLKLIEFGSSLGFVKILRLLRILRPLRMINRNPNMKLVVNALLLSVKPLLNVAVVLMLIWFMFALVGVQFFAGKLYRCNDPFFPPGAPRKGGTVDGAVVRPCDSSVYYNDTFGNTVSREWVNSPSNFDDIISAMVTLYVMATGEGWPTIMFKTADITAVDFQPKRDNQPWNTCVVRPVLLAAPPPLLRSSLSPPIQRTALCSLLSFCRSLRTCIVDLCSLLLLLLRQLLLRPLHIDNGLLLSRARHRCYFPKLSRAQTTDGDRPTNGRSAALGRSAEKTAEGAASESAVPEPPSSLPVVHVKAGREAGGRSLPPMPVPLLRMPQPRAQVFVQHRASRRVRHRHRVVHRRQHARHVRRLFGDAGRLRRRD